MSSLSTESNTSTPTSSSLALPTSSNYLPTTILSTQNEVPSQQTSNSDYDGSSDSWLKQHNRFVFIIFLALIVLGLLIWYIVRSVKGMRKRLAEDNEAQLQMIQALNSHQQSQQTHNKIAHVGPVSTHTTPLTTKTEIAPDKS
jgi:hypothetical protein